MRRSLPTERLEGLLDAERGLQADDVLERRRRYGPNDIVETSRSPWWLMLLDTLGDPMLWFLIGTALLFLFLGDTVEALILLAALAPLSGMDFFLHHRTHASTEGLRTRLATKARAVRDGQMREIDAPDIVPGDLVMLAVGDNIPADGIVVSAESAQLEESALTGESFPVRKKVVALAPPLPEEVSIDSQHWVFAGTRLLSGEVAMRVVFTGAETLYGDIVRSAAARGRERTPLQGAIAHLVGILLVLAGLLCVALALVRLHQGFGVVDALLSAVTLAVAALPEEFPVVFTFFLGAGVYRLAQRQALVRRAVVVENIGRVSCICSDKTGTLTEGELQLTHCYPAEGREESQLLDIAAMASRHETGDPMDMAIFRLARPAEPTFQTLATYPFTEDRKKETAVWATGGEKVVVATKGAPETVLAMCALTESQRSEWERRLREIAGAGHKVIACASLTVDAASWTGVEPAADLEFEGLLAFEDPVRPGVADAVRQCRDSGIHVLMVTGDHPLTAEAVAREIGFGSKEPRVIDATQPEFQSRLTAAALMNADVVARAVPTQKLQIVKLLQSAGETVAVTGDGVNDVPALQAADIGLAMGERGTRSAREAAAIVLLDDNFQTITRAIAEGQRLFRNLRLSFAYLLVIHIPLVLTAALIPFAGYPLLYLPIHIVWLELLIHPTALLVYQGLPAGGRSSSSAKAGRLRFFSRLQAFVVTGTGLAAALVVMGGYAYGLGMNGDVEHARSMAMIMLCLLSALVTAILSGLTTTVSRIMTALTVLSGLALIQTPWLARWLHLRPLHLDDLLISVAAAVGVAALMLPGRFRK